MTVKLITDRRKWKDTIIDLMLKVVRRIDEGLLDDHTPIFGRDPAHLRRTVINLCHRLADAFNAMVAAQLLHSGEVATAEVLAKKRSMLVGALKDDLVRLRGLVSACYGDAGVRALGFSGQTSREPKSVAHLAALVAQRLCDPRLGLQSESTGTVTIDAGTVAAVLREGAELLERILAGLSENRIRRDSAIDYRNEAVSRFDAAAVNAARFLRAVCELTEQKDLAQQVRKAQRLSRRNR